MKIPLWHLPLGVVMKDWGPAHLDSQESDNHQTDSWLVHLVQRGVSTADLCHRIKQTVLPHNCSLAAVTQAAYSSAADTAALIATMGCCFGEASGHPHPIPASSVRVQLGLAATYFLWRMQQSLAQQPLHDSIAECIQVAAIGMSCAMAVLRVTRSVSRLVTPASGSAAAHLL